jgi:hypothetical protein
MLYSCAKNVDDGIITNTVTLFFCSYILFIEKILNSYDIKDCASVILYTSTNAT